MKREIQELMENGWAGPESVRELLSCLRKAQAKRRRHVVLHWDSCGGWIAADGPRSLRIDPLDGGVSGDDEAPHELRYCWGGGRSRRLARGSVEELKAHAERVLSRGGPYGGHSVEPPKRGRRAPYLHFDALRSWEGAEVACYGAGWQMWLRPVSTSRRCLVQVSPTGVFRVIGFGSQTNMALIADHQSIDLGTDDEDMPSGYMPFQVRVGGVPTRLLHATGSQVVGWATTDLGDVFLVLLDEDDAALVLLSESDASDASDEGSEGCELRVLLRGPLGGINDLELAPGTPPAVPLANPHGPIHPTPDICARSIEGMVSAAKIVRDEGVRLVRVAVHSQGMRFARVILRSIFALHEDGRRSCSAGSLAELLGEFVSAGLIEKLPSDRTYRSAMQWVADEIGIVKRLNKTQWAIHYEEIAKPSAELCAEIRDSQRRAMVADAAKVPRAEAGGRLLLH